MVGMRFEDAHPKPIPAMDYQCCQCDRVWHDEHSARRCCASSAPCECGARMPVYHTLCDNCRESRAEREWLEQSFCEWDGSFPVASNRSEKFFWCAEELREAIVDAMETEFDMDGEDVSLSAVELFCLSRRIGECRKQPVPSFDVDYFLEDHVAAGEVVVDADRINAEVDAVIAAADIGPAYYPNGGRIDPKRLATALGVAIKEMRE